MTFIMVYRKSDGVEVPEGHEFLTVISQQVDSQGNWTPNRVEPIANTHELRTMLRNLVQSGEKFVVRGANASGIIMSLGIPLLHTEWGVL